MGFISEGFARNVAQIFKPKVKQNASIPNIAVQD